MLWVFCSHSVQIVVPFGSAGRVRFVVWQVMELVALMSFGFWLRSSARIMHTASYVDVHVVLALPRHVGLPGLLWCCTHEACGPVLLAASSPFLLMHLHYRNILSPLIYHAYPTYLLLAAPALTAQPYNATCSNASHTLPV